MYERQALKDDSSVAALYERHAATILLYIRRHVPSPEDAEDLLLEVFLAAHRNQVLLTLSEEQQLAWLRRVAHNKFIDHHRRTARRVAVPLEEVVETMFDDEQHAPEQMAHLDSEKPASA